MKAREWREKSNEEREKMLTELQDKARVLRFDLSTREAKNHSDYDKIKKEIADHKNKHNEPAFGIFAPNAYAYKQADNKQAILLFFWIWHP